MAHHGSVPVTAGPDVRDLAFALGHSAETWQAQGHTFEPYSGVFRANPYIVISPPPRVVAASAPPAPKESAALAHDGTFILNSRADVVLRSWCAPIAAGRGAAYMPLLVVGQSIWPAVTKVLRQLEAYPTTYDRISLSELPTDDQTLMAFRANTCRSRVIMVGLPSVAAAALFADGVRRLRDMLPQHSFAFFVSAQDVVLDHLPGVLSERYALLTWRDSHAPAVVMAEAAPPDPTVLAMVEASHTRLGGMVGLGVTPGQRLGLEHTPYRDAAFAAMHHEAAVAARRIAAMEGSLHDVKRVKVSHFNRGAGVVMHNSAHTKMTGLDQ
jgi:hypothetical protein